MLNVIHGYRVNKVVLYILLEVEIITFVCREIVYQEIYKVIVIPIKANLVVQVEVTYDNYEGF